MARPSGEWKEIDVPEPLLRARCTSFVVRVDQISNEVGGTCRQDALAATRTE